MLGNIIIVCAALVMSFTITLLILSLFKETNSEIREKEELLKDLETPNQLTINYKNHEKKKK